MGDLTKNLSRHEFACDCGCGMDTADHELVVALQAACDRFGDRITVTGGNRCADHNATIPGATSGSKHQYCRAADFKLFKNGVQVDPEKVAQFFEQRYSNFGIGRYSNRTHVDSRTDGPARWDMR